MAVRILLSQNRSLYRLLFQPLHSQITQSHRIGLCMISACTSDLSVPAFGFRLSLFQRLSSQTIGLDPNISSAEDVNEICRVLSDFRSLHHDIESALACFSGKISSDLVEQVLKRCKNLSFSAHRFFLWAKKLPGFIHSTESYHILVDILGSNKQFALIWDFLSEMKDGGHEIKPKIFWIVFRAYCRADLPMDAIRAYKKMQDFGPNPSIDDLDKLLFMLCKRNHVKHAQEFFDDVKYKSAPSEKTYSILMRGWGEIGDSMEAWKLFDEMLERKCPIDVTAYNTLLDCLCRDGKTEEAYKLFREMGSYGFQPDACSYSIFIRAYCEANDTHSALRVLDRMRRYNLAPNVFTYNCIIKLFCKNDHVDDAYLLLDEMFENEVKPDAWSYNAILAFHCDCYEVNQALKLINRMDIDSCLPDSHTYNMVLKMLIRVGRVDRVTEVWESMERRGFYPSVSTYAVMIHGYCKKKHGLEDACRYFEMMIDEGIPPYLSTCDLLRDRLLHLGLWEKTQILAEKMRQSTSCSIQELSSSMESNKATARLRKFEREN
ncbi:pentatricopeptide repeat-containing protein At1g52640, mitochondrial-like isoform X1 [Telopea speciosissima]|uniref:pentatricopeptide repeat-containing protein At1g52640, mitochondrial-like isoform X1 n=1 Tax=Telopea speciosissima TaxID=54955 RepID=UPI001CC8076B|nr:pentatricopeptide repeat-containing protein At1g52640, mitochondrial-like isoform X1 [Telopea speciosissima]